MIIIEITAVNLEADLFSRCKAGPTTVDEILKLHPEIMERAITPVASSPQAKIWKQIDPPKDYFNSILAVRLEKVLTPEITQNIYKNFKELYHHFEPKAMDKREKERQKKEREKERKASARNAKWANAARTQAQVSKKGGKAAKASALGAPKVPKDPPHVAHTRADKRSAIGADGLYHLGYWSKYSSCPFLTSDTRDAGDAAHQFLKSLEPAAERLLPLVEELCPDWLIAQREYAFMNSFSLCISSDII
jgi:hypothetical protein